MKKGNAENKYCASCLKTTMFLHVNNKWICTKCSYQLEDKKK